MLRVFLRLIVTVFSSLVILLFGLQLLGSTWNNRMTIYTFFAESEHCDLARCFLGVVPDNTRTTDINDLFDESMLVGAYRLRAVEIQIRHLDWEWSGIQPDFMQAEGFIEFSAGVVSDMQVYPELWLGDMLVTFSEPDTITTSIFDAYLHYPDNGFSLQVGINCNLVWHSNVTVLYRLPTSVPLDTFTLDEAIDSLCINHRSHFP